MAPNAKDFLRRSEPKDAVIHASWICTFQAKGSGLYIQTVDRLSRDDIINAYKDLKATLPELSPSATKYRKYRKDPRWDAGTLDQINECAERIRCIIAELKAALAYLARMEKEGRVPTAFNYVAGGVASDGDDLAFSPFWEVSEIRCGRGWPNYARYTMKLIKENIAVYKTPIPRCTQPNCTSWSLCVVCIHIHRY